MAVDMAYERQFHIDRGSVRVLLFLFRDNAQPNNAIPTVLQSTDGLSNGFKTFSLDNHGHGGLVAI